jgi:CDP-diglyceride synthetase
VSAVAPGAKVLKYPGQASPAKARGKQAVSLLIVYLVLMIVGDIAAYLIGLIIERNAPAVSLPAFLAMYFLFLWVAWIIAVKVTEPKETSAQAPSV